MKKDLLQAYKQAPWRTQIQWVGAFLLVVIAIAAVSGLYLFISGRSAATGRRIQNLENEVAALHRQNNDLETQLGEIRSEQALSERAKALDMRPLKPGEVLYLEVPGYVPAGGPNLAPPPMIIEERTPLLMPEFTSTFLDWIASKLQATTLNPTPTSEVQP